MTHSTPQPGPTVVLVHGAFADAGSWESVTERLVAAGVPVMAIVNPARAIGPMILAGHFSDWWAYLTEPLAGGVAAVALYDRFLRSGSPPAWGRSRGSRAVVSSASSALTRSMIIEPSVSSKSFAC